MKSSHILISLATSPGNTTADENKPGLLKLNDLYKQHKGDNYYENQYSIVRKVHEGEHFIESHSITVNKKPFSNKRQNRYGFKRIPVVNKFFYYLGNKFS